MSYILENRNYFLLWDSCRIIFNNNTTTFWINSNVYFILSWSHELFSYGFVDLICRVLYIFTVNEPTILIHTECQGFNNVFTYSWVVIHIYSINLISRNIYILEAGILYLAWNEKRDSE